MHPLRLTNKQIQDTIVDLRKQLKFLKAIDGQLTFTCKLPTQTRDKATLKIEEPAWKKIMALVDECSKEVAWHGTVSKHNNTYIIEDIYVFPQTVTGATVTSDETEYSMWLMQQPDAVFNKLRFHGHSHVNMGVRPSGVDTAYQDNVLKNLKDFYIFAIFNKRGDNWCTIYDVEDNIVYEDTDIELVTPDISTTIWAQSALKTFVKERVTPTSSAKKNTKKTDKKEEKEESVVDEIMRDYYARNGESRAYDYYGGYYGQD